MKKLLVGPGAGLVPLLVVVVGEAPPGFDEPHSLDVSRADIAVDRDRLVQPLVRIPTD